MRKIDFYDSSREEQDQFLLLSLLSVVTLFGLFVVLYPQTVMFHTFDEQRAQSHVIKTLQNDLLSSEVKQSSLAKFESKQHDVSLAHVLSGVDLKSSSTH